MTAGRWAPSQLFGLWVIADYRPPYGYVRPPYARLTCPHGCYLEAFGAEQVATFTKSIAFIHARRCPGPATPTTSGRT